jgi:hypothetical protein
VSGAMRQQRRLDFLGLSRENPKLSRNRSLAAPTLWEGSSKYPVSFCSAMTARWKSGIIATVSYLPNF